MAKTKTRKDEGIEIIDDPEVLMDKAEVFFSEKKNRNLVFGIGSVIVLLVAGFFGYKLYIDNLNTEAQKEMFQAVFYFEADDFGQALNGDGNSLGFLDVIADYPGTPAANLSSFYAGASYLKLSDFPNAVRYLADFSSSDFLLQARAYSLMGDAYMEQDDFANAVKWYEEAANHKANKEFTPVYLFKLAVAKENAGDLKGAAAAYGKIVSDYINAPLVQDAKKHKARLEGLAAQ